MDGELDPAAMAEVDDLIDRDSPSQQFIVRSVRSTALLKSRLNSAMHEQVPERLLDTVRSRPGANQRWRVTANVYRLAAAVLLVLIGYGASFFAGGSGKTDAPFEVAPLLSRYGHVLDAALENNLSGTPDRWQAPGNSMTITVTPVKTYRDAGNQYYREYRLRIASNAGEQNVGGLAYRTGAGKWKTKMLFF